MIAAVILLLVIMDAFGSWALVRSAADADRQIARLMEEFLNERETES